MSRGLISVLLAIGSSAWVYAQLQRRSGNNTRQSLMAAGIGAVVIFVVIFVILGMILK